MGTVDSAGRARHLSGWVLTAAALGLSVVSVTSAGEPSSSPTRQKAPSMAQFIKIHAQSAGQLSPDGWFYYIYNPDELYQLYRKPADASPENDAAQKLTSFEDGISSYQLCRDGRWIVAAAAKGGDEQDDLYLLNTSTGELETLFAEPDAVFGSIVWRRDSKAFAYRANLEGKSDFYVYVYDLATRKSRRVLDRKGMWVPADFNRSGDKLVAGKYTSATHSQLFEIDLPSGVVREITPANEQWTFQPVGYSADERRFLVLTNYRGDLLNLCSIDLSSGDIQPVAPEYNRWEADAAAFNEERTILAVLLNEDGYSALRLRRMPENRPLKETPALAEGIIGNIDFCGAHMLCSLNNAHTPNTIHRWSLDEPASKPIPLTKADTRGIDLTKLPLPRLIHYRSFDKQLEIPAFLYTPPGYEPGTPIPFIINYHGGPEGQYRPYFSRVFQYFCSRGFGVLAPNVRGSSGYGKRYLEMDNYKKRMDSVMDGVWAARWLVQNGYSTPGKIGAYGGSYGGFMAVGVVAQAPKLFGAACNVVGIVNFKTFLERTKAYRRKLREVEYGPLTDPEFLESISPIRLVDHIETPMLIAHGRNDPRVPVYEAEQLYDALRARGRVAELLIFDDEGHGFYKEKNRVEFYQKLADFFERHLK